MHTNNPHLARALKREHELRSLVESIIASIRDETLSSRLGNLVKITSDHLQTISQTTAQLPQKAQETNDEVCALLGELASTAKDATATEYRRVLVLIHKYLGYLLHDYLLAINHAHIEQHDDLLRELQYAYNDLDQLGYQLSDARRH